MNATDQQSQQPGVRPTIALVHGAFADSSSWNGVIERLQRPAGADVIRAEAQRAGAAITEVEGSHVIMISQPQAVTDVIVTAATAVAGAHR
jgi:hypothetical protein